MPYYAVCTIIRDCTFIRKLYVGIYDFFLLKLKMHLWLNLKFVLLVDGSASSFFILGLS